MTTRPTQTPMHTLRHLIGLAMPFWRWILLSTLLGFLTIGASIGLLATSAWIISKAALQPSVAEIQTAIVGVRFFGISRGLFRYLERLVSHNTTFKVLAQIRVWFYSALEPLAPARLMQYRSGDLLNRIMGDVDTLENFYVRVLAPPLVAVGIGLLMALIMGSFMPALIVVVLGFMLLLGIGVPVLARALSREPGQAIVQTRAALSASLVDGIQGMADIVAFGAEQEHMARIAALNTELTRQQRRLAHIDGLQAGLGVGIVSIAVTAVLWAAIPHVDGIYLATLAMATIAAFEAIIPLPQTAQMLDENLAAAGRLLDITEGVFPSITEPAQPSPQPQHGTLQINDLSFTYPSINGQGSDMPALQGVSFSVRQGQRVAVVGPSGAGKSTLVNLLLRFWDYAQGQVMLGGHDLRSYKADDARAMIGVVAQQTHLFRTSVRDNLLLANEAASEAQIIAAAKQAHIHDFIMNLPEGYATMVGEQGLNLSGGERQRIAIARALLKNAPLLILDEATANLDAATEQMILGEIDGLAEGRATLVITHRLVGLDRVDQIIVMDGGRVVQQGTHAELIAQDGLYRHMWQQQRDTLDQETAG